MEKSRIVIPHALTPLNGCVLDLENKVGTLELQKGPFRKNVEAAPVAARHLPEVVIFEHIDFGGANDRTNLNWYYVGDWWNDRISSIIVVSGVWRFYQHWHYEGAYWDLGPGYYRWVEAANIPNDMISSFKCIALTE